MPAVLIIVPEDRKLDRLLELVGMAEQGKRERLLELVEAELEEREADRQYQWAVAEYTAGTAPRPAESRPTAPLVEPAPAPTSPPEPAPEYVGTREAARLLGISPRTLEGLRLRGEGPPCIRVGRAVRYRREDLRKPAK